MAEAHLDVAFFGLSFIVCALVLFAPGISVIALSLGRRRVSDLNTKLVFVVRLCAAVAAAGCIVVMLSAKAAS